MNSEQITTFLDKMGGGGPAFRLCLLLLVCSSSLAALVPESIIGNLLKGASYVGYVVFALSGVGIVETIINDLLPDKYHWQFALNIRHLALMACSAFFLILIFLLTQSSISMLVLPYFVIVATFLAWNAFMDIRIRFGPGKIK